MFFHIDSSNGLAIYDQVIRQIKFAVARGALLPGHLVPSVREMARELTINPNTVARAYRQLQADGVLQAVRGMGLEVAQDAVKHCRDARQKMLRDRVHQALVEAQQSGLDGDDLRQLVEKQLANVLREGRK